MNIDFGKGITKKYIDFDIDESVSLSKQVDLLKEDLIQVIYSNDLMIDVGWYPEFEQNGTFKISLIKDYNWNDYIFQKNCNTLSELKTTLLEYIKYVQTKLK